MDRFPKSSGYVSRIRPVEAHAGSVWNGEVKLISHDSEVCFFNATQGAGWSSTLPYWYNVSCMSLSEVKVC